MSDTLWGVVVGGITASVIPLITLYLSSKKWKKKMKVDYLKEKKEDLENRYKKASSLLSKGMKEEVYSIDMISDFDFLFPPDVQKIFEKHMLKEDHTPEQNRSDFYSIKRAMKKSLSNIDKQIENEILFSENVFIGKLKKIFYNFIKKPSQA